MGGGSVARPMRRRLRRRSRGLAEIVGTLMLVVIVVAAATAFAFFVAAYQKELQAQETITHDRALEAIKVIGVTETPCSGHPGCPSSDACLDCFGWANFTVASLDINQIDVDNLFLDHLPVVNFSASIRGSASSPCYNASNLSDTNFGVEPCKTLVIPGDATAILSFNLGACFHLGCGALPARSYWALGYGSGPGTFAPSSPFDLQLLTGLGNEFTETLSPPVAIASVFYVSGSAGTSVPVFDGLSSYQPKGADNASVSLYDWTISGVGASTDTDCNDGIGTGGEFECPGLASGDYTVGLTVTNSDGLIGAASIPFDAP